MPKKDLSGERRSLISAHRFLVPRNMGSNPNHGGINKLELYSFRFTVLVIGRSKVAEPPTLHCSSDRHLSLSYTISHRLIVGSAASQSANHKPRLRK